MNVLKIPKEHKDHVIRNIQHFFHQERGEEIGTLAAEHLLDFMIKQVGPYVYNQAIADSRKLIVERMTAIEDELYAMERPAAK